MVNLNVEIIIFFFHPYCFTHLIVEVYLYSKPCKCYEKVVRTIYNTKQGITHNKESSKTQSNETIF
jgi:hypothetical protein